MSSTKMYSLAMMSLSRAMLTTTSG